MEKRIDPPASRRASRAATMDKNRQELSKTIWMRVVFRGEGRIISFWPALARRAAPFLSAASEIFLMASCSTILRVAAQLGKRRQSVQDAGGSR